MARNSTSVAGSFYPVGKVTETDEEACPALTPRQAFASCAHAQFLEELGWRVVPFRFALTAHPPASCCFVLRDDCQAEAAFGFTGLAGPSDVKNPHLRGAKAQVEASLAELGESRGLLLQNTPIFAFGGQRRERLAIFGGWRVEDGNWEPFLLGPKGLGETAAHAPLFATGTVPARMAEVAGHLTDRVLPRVHKLAMAIETLGKPAQETRLQIEPFVSGWYLARAVAAVNVAPFGPTRAASNSPWGPEADEFRFRHESEGLR